MLEQAAAISDNTTMPIVTIDRGPAKG